LTAYDDNGNTIQIMNIKKRYLKKLYEDIGILINKKDVR